MELYIRPFILALLSIILSGCGLVIIKPTDITIENPTKYDTGIRARTRVSQLSDQQRETLNKSGNLIGIDMISFYKKLHILHEDEEDQSTKSSFLSTWGTP